MVVFPTTTDQAAIAQEFFVTFRLTRKQRRRLIGVQPIDSYVAETRCRSSSDNEKHSFNCQTNNDTSGFSVTPAVSLPCEARLSDANRQ